MEGDGRRRTWGKVRAVLAEKKTGGPVVSELEGRHSHRGEAWLFQNKTTSSNLQWCFFETFPS